MMTSIGDENVGTCFPHVTLYNKDREKEKNVLLLPTQHVGTCYYKSSN